MSTRERIPIDEDHQHQHRTPRGRGFVVKPPRGVFLISIAVVAAMFFPLRSVSSAAGDYSGWVYGVLTA